MITLVMVLAIFSMCGKCLYGISVVLPGRSVHGVLRRIHDVHVLEAVTIYRQRFLFEGHGYIYMASVCCIVGGNEPCFKAYGYVIKASDSKVAAVTY